MAPHLSCRVWFAKARGSCSRAATYKFSSSHSILACVLNQGLGPVGPTMSTKSSVQGADLQQASSRWPSICTPPGTHHKVSLVYMYDLHVNAATITTHAGLSEKPCMGMHVCMAFMRIGYCSRAAPSDRLSLHAPWHLQATYAFGGGLLRNWP